MKETKYLRFILLKVIWNMNCLSWKKFLNLIN
jgi:hypothetical protein